MSGSTPITSPYQIGRRTGGLDPDDLTNFLINEQGSTAYIQRVSGTPTGALVDPATGLVIALANSSVVPQAAQISQTTGLPIQIGRSTTPDQIAGLTCWFDASQPMYTAGYGAQVANLGDQIGVWPDRSGNLITLTPSATKPTFNPTGMNGKPTINFNGNSTFVTSTSILTSAFNTAMTVFVVSQALAGAGIKAILGFTGASNFLDQNDAAKTFGFNFNGLTPNLGVTSNYVNAAGVFAYVYNGTSQFMAYDRTINTNNGVFGNASAASGAASGGTSPVATTGTLGLSGPLTIGDTSSGGSTWPGQISEVIIYNAVLTPEQVREIYDYLSAKWGFSAKKTVVAMGNSRTSGTGSTGTATQVSSPAGTNYPSQLWAALGSTAWDVRTDAYPGRYLSQMIAETPTFGDLLWLPQASPKNIAVVWEVINTLTATGSSGACINQLVQFCKYQRAQGFKVVVCTEVPRTPTGVYAGLQADVNVVNAYIRANWGAFSDGLADLQADSRLQNYSNLTYFYTDNIHLTNAGYAVVAGIVQAAVLAL
jgi:hypothetical protein